MSKNPITERASLPSTSTPGFLPSIITTAVLSLAIGYWIGVGNSLFTFGSSKSSRRKKNKGDDGASSSSDVSSEDESESPGPQLAFEECKMVLVVRTDLGMTKGKAAAQCGHATLACYKSALKHHPNLVRFWEASGQAKVALQVKSEEELLKLQEAAMSRSLTAKIIHDAGRTQIAAGSSTVLGVGPGPKSVIDQITGTLKLY